MGVRSQGWSARNALGSVAISAFILVISAIAGFFSLRDGSAVLGLSAALLITSIVLLDGGRRDFFTKYGWIPYAWIALSLVPDFHFTFRSTLDNSVSTVSLENFVQVGIYALVMGLVLSSRRLMVLEDPRPLRKGPLLAWPLAALASTLWSPIPLFSFVRALQLLVPIGLALFMVRIWLSSPGLGAAIWRDTLRLFVRVVTILVLIGLATGFWSERFAWPGTHPGVVAMYCAIAILILIARGRKFLGLRLSGYVFRLVVLVAAVYRADTRTAIIALAVAIAVLFWSVGRTKLSVRYLGVFYYVVAASLALLVARAELLRYLSRGATAATNASLTGRVPLWETAIQLLSEAHKWFTGFGYGAARVILPLHTNWNAGTAHSTWIELLFDIGVLGPLLVAAGFTFLFVQVSGRRAVADPALSLSLVVFLAVASITSDTLALPGLGFVTLALLYVPALAGWNATLVSRTADVPSLSPGR
jgi:hypothetical protein